MLWRAARVLKRHEIIWQRRRSTALSATELIKSGQAVWLLISGPAPEQAYCSCLTTYRLLFATSELWQEGFQQQLWSLSACHLALATPGSGASSFAPGRTGRRMEDTTGAEQSAQCCRADVWVLANILRCVPHVSALSWPHVCCPYSSISLVTPTTLLNTPLASEPLLLDPKRDPNFSISIWEKYSLTHSSDFHCHDFTHVCCTACF